MRTAHPGWGPRRLAFELAGHGFPCPDLDGSPFGEDDLVGSGTEITAEVQHGVVLVRVPVLPAPAVA
jgi:hypothetical protein